MHFNLVNNSYQQSSKVLFTFVPNKQFTNCISKINNVLTDNAEDLDVVMSMCSLLEYGKSFKNNRKVLELLRR